MDYKYINQLLERYWRCETTLEEEEILRTFFSQAELPAELKLYQQLFAYEQNEKKAEELGEDFDQKVMTIIGREEAEHPHHARVVSITERLKPLFKAAAIVAIFLTLGNALQVPFSNGNVEYVGSVETIKTMQGESVAMSDSAKIDSMQQSVLDPAVTQPSPTILK